MSTTGHESWRDQAEQAATGAAPDPDQLNPPAAASAADEGTSAGISAFNQATEQAKSAAGEASEAAAEAHAAAGEATSAAEDARSAATSRVEAATEPVPVPPAAVPAATAPVPADGGETVPMKSMKLGMAVTNAGGKFFFGLARVLLGWVFFWAFLDKLFGLGKSTPSDRSWINGGSPTNGYLSNVDGPFKSFFNSMAGQTWADWLFMIGLAAIGAALILGIGMWIAAISGTVLLVFMWMASLPIQSNPFLDEHLVYAVVLLGLAFVRGGDFLGLGKPWAKTGLVRALPFLR